MGHNNEKLIVKMAINPFEAVCYGGYDKELDRWYGPPGRGILLAEDLRRRINFTSQLLYADGKWGAPVKSYDSATGQNVTRWNGIVGMLERGEADWSPCLVYQSLGRARVIDFSPTPYGISELVGITHIPSAAASRDTLNFESILQPFSDIIWTFFAVSIFVYCLALTSISLVYTAAYRRANVRYTLLTTIYQLINICRPFLMQSYEYDAKNPKNHSIVFRLQVVIWIFSMFLLSIFYGGELISYLTMQDSKDWIRDYSDLVSRLTAGSVTGLAFKSGFIFSDAASLFNSTAVASRMISGDSIRACLDTLLGDWQNSKAVKRAVWLEMSLEADRIMRTAGVRALSAPGTPPRGSHAYESKEFLDREMYFIGRGEGKVMRSAAVVFSRASPPRVRAAQKVFNRWIRWYYELGFIRWWTEKSIMDTVLMYTAAIRDRRAAAHIHGESLMFDDSLTLEGMIGSFAVYVLFSLFAVCAAVSEISFFVWF